MPIDPQERVFALLVDPATHGGHTVRRIDTHAASVFLAGPRAYKAKRAVRFPFLDYSTLEKRKAACEAELEVNASLAPMLYRRVVAITEEADGTLILDGTGRPVEWAVEMNRFDEARTLDRLAETGALSAELAVKLGRAVAAAHSSAPVAEAESWIGAFASFIEQNEADFRSHSDLFPASQVDDLSNAARRSLHKIRPLLARRAELGFIRRTHGDLHLGNIALIDDEPVLFDAIEFDPLIGSGDVLYDLAFLLMDLVERELGEAANIVLNTYLSETRRDDHLDGLRALPLFLSVRAAIRAKVTAARLQTASAQQSAIAEQAQAYFGLAQRLIAPPKPVLIAVGGLSGTGKTLLARALSPLLPPAPGAVLLRSDTERKMLHHVKETERLPQAAYASSATDKVYELLFEKAARIIRAGHSAVVDGVFAHPVQRASAERLGLGEGAGFVGLFLEADLETRLSRTGHRAHDASDADSAVARLQETYELGSVTWIRIDASGTPAETLRQARSTLQSLKVGVT
jgi:aminoglycoside phosphotransferase family enzyme/predicted kinase